MRKAIDLRSPYYRIIGLFEGFILGMILILIIVVLLISKLGSSKIFAKDKKVNL